MEKDKTLKAIMKMAEDNNCGLRMSTTLTGVKEDPRGAIVSFGVEKTDGEDARLQLAGLPNKYMICCFFIDREEFEKYKD